MSIPWDRDAVLAYLDACIRLWRRVIRESEPGTPDMLEAACYVDAFQSMRVSIFGVPKEPDDPEARGS